MEKEMEATPSAAECFSMSFRNKGFRNSEFKWLYRGGDSRDGLDQQEHRVGTKAVVSEGTEGSVWPLIGREGHELRPEEKRSR